MKIALIADVHGNLPALEAVLRHARDHGAAQKILNLGDLTGYGPFPEEVVRWSRSPQVVNILGDYDKKVLSKKQRDSGWAQVKTPHKREMFAWTFAALSKQARRHLRSLPEHRIISIAGVQITLSHGSPAAHQDYLGPDTPEDQLVELAASTGSAAVLSGHTHQAYARQVGGTLFINPGTVGRPDDGDPRASYAILAIEGDHLAVQHYRVPYDLMAAVKAVRLAGLPEVFTQVIRRGLNYADTVAALENAPGSDQLEPSGIVSLLTDFGLKDHFVGVMKGVIAGIAPQAQQVDISHQVYPQSVDEGARMLAQAVAFFPPGTVHVVVVDPGVGTTRRALAGQIGTHFYVAPDNGLLTLLLEQARDAGQPVRLIALTEPGYWLPEPSAIFHGRDIFAPVGAHLANGVPLTCLGDDIDDPVLLTLTTPQPTGTGWQATVARIDGFGNVLTDLPASALQPGQREITITLGDETIQGLSRTFGDASPGTLIALIDSTGHLAVAKVNGNAAEQLQVMVGAPVFVDVH